MSTREPMIVQNMFGAYVLSGTQERRNREQGRVAVTAGRDGGWYVQAHGHVSWQPDRDRALAEAHHIAAQIKERTP